MNKTITMFVLIFAVITCHANNLNNIQIKDFYIVMLPGADNASGYGVIVNAGDKADMLMSVSSNNTSIMLHQTQIHTGMANMVRSLNFLIKAKDSFVLKPMSYHLMLTHISKDIDRETNTIIIKFEFKNSDAISVKIPILSRHKYN
ncbi:MAG: hypothetical protein DSY43_05810 [Gammaproteobacteria bacterium]|nr:MAG: hypothetical protein DSY43_05810 [Gammaproteobacteria bacterium]